jgi:prevent-host-death family protein
MRITNARKAAKTTSKQRKPARKATTKQAGPAPARTMTVTSTKAQNTFGSIVDRATRDGVVMITRHAKPRVVLLSYERYRDLVGTEATLLPSLAAAFDAQLVRLQTPDVWKRTVAGFRASPAAMSRAALAAARAGSSARRG